MPASSVAARIIRRIPSEEVLDLIDRRALFAGRWGYKNMGQRRRLELESRLLGMWAELASPDYWTAGAVWISFEAECGKGGLLIRDAGRSAFLAIKAGGILQPAAGPGKIALQAVTLGTSATRFVKQRSSVAEKYIWHGLAAETAEALAEWCSRKAAGVMGWGQWRRISPGFPAWPDLAEQRKLFRLLRPQRVGIKLSPLLQMVPEYSTSAALFAI